LSFLKVGGLSKRPERENSLPDTRDASLAQQASVMHTLLRSVEPKFALGNKIEELLASYPDISSSRGVKLRRQ
jgi:hypothetical protein